MKNFVNIFGDVLIYFLLLFVVANTILLFISYRSTQLVTQTLQNNYIEEQLFSDIKDAECGQRGYLLTEGDEAYLPQYYVGIASAKADMIVLQEYVKDLPDSALVVKQLQKEVNLKLTELEATVRAYRRGDPAEAIAMVKTNNGMKDMEHIRTLIGVLRAQERHRLRNRHLVF